MRRMSLTGLKGQMVSTEAEHAVIDVTDSTVPVEPVDNTEVTTVVVDTPPANADGAVLEAVAETPSVSTEPAEPAAEPEVELPAEEVVVDPDTTSEESTPVAKPVVAEVPAEPTAEPAPIETPTEEVPTEAETVSETPAEPVEAPEAEIPATVPVEEPANADTPTKPEVVAEVLAETPAEVPEEVTPETPATEPAAEVPAAAEPTEEIPAEPAATEPVAESDPEAEPETPVEVPEESTPAEAEVSETPASTVTPDVPAALAEPEAVIEVPAHPVVPESEPAAVEAPESPTVIATPDVIIQAGAELGNNTDTLEEDLATVKAEAEEAEADDSEIDETEAVVEALESLVFTMESSLKENGLDHHGAAILSIATEHLLDSVGFSQKRQATVSLESFSPDTTSILSRRVSTESAIENVKEHIKKIIAAIHMAIKKAIAWLIQRFSKIIDAAELLKSRAEKIVKAAEEAEDDPNAPATFKSVLLASHLRIGKGPSVQIPSDIETLFDTASVVLGAMQTRNESIGEGLVKAVENQQMSNFKPLELLGKLLLGFTVRENSNLASAGMTVATTVELLGGQCVYSVYPATGNMVEGHIAECRSGMMAFNHDVVVSNKDDVTRLTVKEAASMARTISQIAGLIIKCRESVKRVEALEERCTKAADRLGMLAIAEEGEYKEDLLHCQKIARHLPRILTQPSEAFCVYALQTGKAALLLAEMSIQKKK